MAWKITTPLAGAQGITVHSTTKNHQLGTIIQAEDPTYGAGEFIYLEGIAGVAAKAWVFYNKANKASNILADGYGQIAIAMAATVASEYGWFQISGRALGLCKTQIADLGRVCLTSTSWTVDDASVTGDLVANAICAATTVVDSGYTTFDIMRPFSNNDMSTGN